MWFFNKKKSFASLDLSWLGTDMHSHLVPGIDDGAGDPKASLTLIRGLQSLGFKKLITTPHIFWELYPNTPEKIAEGLSIVQANLKEEGIELELRAAAEYFMDEHLEDLLRKKEPLLTLSGNKVLVEVSMVMAPLDLPQLLFELQVQGYQPILAHPERYTYIAGRKEIYDELKEAGCLFQLNLLSLTGYYGRAVQDLAEYLCKKESYDFAGTDLHHERHLAALQKLASSSTFSRLRDSGKLKNAEL